jgi:hypothetical protein
LDHRLSVRSVATLPAYNAVPLPSERLIAREGERAGVDTVVEYPESENEAENRREEEMRALHAIREARRREQAEREARRVERREARERRDWARLRELEEESRARARSRSNASAISDSEGNPNGSSEAIQLTATNTNRSQQDSAYLIAELNSLREYNSRNRRVSSVSYAELGVARHDGSRIRADSVDSDHAPLLDTAAPMGGRTTRSRATSIVSSRDNSRPHSRAAPDDRRPSTSGSYLSQDDDGRSGYLTPHSRDDLPPDPPSYEDDISVHGGEVPPYESPVVERNPTFPAAPTPAQATSRDHIESSVNLLPAAATSSGNTQDGFEPTPTEAAAATSELPPLRLNTTTNSNPPSIEIMSATPITSVPLTPLSHRRPNQ